MTPEAKEGLVLRQIAFKESSVILHVYTADGLESVLVHRAKQWKSPFLRIVEPMTLIRYHASGKQLMTLTDADIVEDYRELKSDLERQMAASHLLELTQHHAEGDFDHAKWYPFLKNILKLLSHHPRFDLIAMLFELKLFYLLGVQPQLRGCVVCGNKNALRLSVSAGGAVCIDHLRPDAMFDEDVVFAAALLYFHDIKVALDWPFDSSVDAKLRDFIDQYAQYHLHFLSKSRQLWMGLHTK